MAAFILPWKVGLKDTQFPDLLHLARERLKREGVQGTEKEGGDATSDEMMKVRP